MSDSTFIVRAPSNIALIKYMGKSDAALNLPENPSLSMTLDSLCTWVEARKISEPEIRFAPGLPRGAESTERAALSEAAKDRMSRHVRRVQSALSLGTFGLELRTANTFPASSGIASSASSFAAVTLAVALVGARDPRELRARFENSPELRRELATVSRQGSGSSCRSFEGPFVAWEGERAAQVPSRLPELAHLVLIVSREPKKISSSEAHARVKSSPLWAERVARVEQRFTRLRAAIAEGNLPEVARTAWLESWEMHSLFHTAAEPFSYWEPATIDLLHWFGERMKEEDAPIVTMDAGPNVHVIVPRAKKAAWRARIEERFPRLEILEDLPGSGARVVEIS